MSVWTAQEMAPSKKTPASGHSVSRGTLFYLVLDSNQACMIRSRMDSRDRAVANKELRNQERKRRRLLKKAASLDENDLLEVFTLRQETKAKAVASAKAKAAAKAAAGAGNL